MREKKELNIQIGSAVRAARERAGMTQAELGEVAGLGTKNVSDIERGVVGVSVPTLRVLCEKLCVSSDELLFGPRDASDADLLAQRLARLTPRQFAAVKAFLDQTLLFLARTED